MGSEDLPPSHSTYASSSKEVQEYAQRLMRPNLVEINMLRCFGARQEP